MNINNVSLRLVPAARVVAGVETLMATANARDAQTSEPIQVNKGNTVK